MTGISGGAGPGNGGDARAAACNGLRYFVDFPPPLPNNNNNNNNNNINTTNNEHDEFL